jgi:hypothetical protein
LRVAITAGSLGSTFQSYGESAARNDAGRISGKSSRLHEVLELVSDVVDALELQALRTEATPAQPPLPSSRVRCF